MNKVKQNKITFSLILLSIVVTFSSLTVLSLPVLFNYESKVTQIEKNFYKNFKIHLNTSGKVSYKPFPKPHLLVENASISLEPDKKKENSVGVIGRNNRTCLAMFFRFCIMWALWTSRQRNNSLPR